MIVRDESGMTEKTTSKSKVLTLFKGSAILVFANIILKTINFFLLPLYTEYLTPAELGLSDAISNFVSLLLPICSLSLDLAFGAFYFRERSEEYIRRIFNTLHGALTLLGLIPIILTFFADPIAKVVFGSQDHKTIVIVALLSMSLTIWSIPYAQYLKLQNRFLAFSMVTIISSLIYIATNIIFVAVLELGAMALILSGAILACVQLTIYIIVTKPPRSMGVFDKKLFRSMLAFSLPLIPSALVLWVLNLSDRLMLYWLAGGEEVGVYGIAVRLAVVITVISNGVQVAYTTFAFDKQGEINAKDAYAKVLDIYFYLLIGICFTVSLFSKEIIYLMTTEGFYSSYGIIPALLYTQVVFGVYSIVKFGLSFTEKNKFILLAVSGGATSNLLLNYWLIPKYGSVAAGYTSLVGALVMLGLAYCYAQKFYYCNYKINKLILILSGTLVVAIVSQNLDFTYKIGIWLVIAIVVTSAYLDRVKMLIELIQQIVSKDKKG